MPIDVVVKASNIHLEYPNGNKALHDISFEFKSGEIVYVIGPSGSGKTSLLKLMLGIEKPTKGILSILGTDLKDGNIMKLRREIGPVFQEFRLLEGRTALENVMLGLRFLNFSSSEIKALSEDALVRVGLSHKIYSNVDHLSWGESQRVAIARAIARKPKLIIADEPTGNLDHENAMNILNLLTAVKDKETTAIITTHATHLIGNTKKHHLIRMNQGHLIWEKTQDE